MRIVMAGASGFLGTHLTSDLTARGHQVVRLVRREPRGPDEVHWDPHARALAPAALAGVDAVVNLSGAGVGDHRWTEAYKRQIRASRVDTTATIARALAAVPPDSRPAALLNASAVGWYGDTGDRAVDESAPAGEGFLSDVCKVWEAATRPAEDAGVRVVRMRTGLPLDAGGGLLKPMLLPFRLGVGGRLGGGRQYLSWISLTDWLAAVRFLLDRDDLAGPVNVVGPNPCTNAEFTEALGRVVHRPAVLTVPSFALRVALGGFAHETLVSLRVLPGVLTRAGFAFTHQTVTSALRAALDR
ncbi:MAG TPA: TIGR01777 family oxidoreductase [Micromonosporaceae bacterium]